MVLFRTPLFGPWFVSASGCALALAARAPRPVLHHPRHPARAAAVLHGNHQEGLRAAVLLPRRPGGL
eukprot:3762372-Alexandrium_andersonii.AAC.1